eukprot:COSAG02_NODE_183_length_30560_cov_8.912695_13_plen_83_part_00
MSFPAMIQNAFANGAYLECLESAPMPVRFACMNTIVKKCDESFASGFSFTTCSYDFKMIATGATCHDGHFSVQCLQSECTPS